MGLQHHSEVVSGIVAPSIGESLELLVEEHLGGLQLVHGQLVTGAVTHTPKTRDATTKVNVKLYILRKICWRQFS